MANGKTAQQNSPDGAPNKEITFRAPGKTIHRWKVAAALKGWSLSEFARRAMTERANRILEEEKVALG